MDSDRKELRNAGDTKGKKPLEYDQSLQFAEYFNTVWDYAKEGNVRKLTLVLDSGRFEVNEQTMRLKNTPLHVAVCSQQLEIIKTLVYDYQADPVIVNAQGKSAFDMAKAITAPKGSATSSEDIKSHVMGLLNKLHTSTKLPGNTSIKKEKEINK